MITQRTIGLLSCILATAALAGCLDPADGGEPASEDQGAAVTSTPEAEQVNPQCTTPTGYTLSFTSYDSDTITLSIGKRTVILTGETVAFRRRRYKNDTYTIDVHKGLGEYGGYIFDAAGTSLGTCILRRP
ncbi:hypothetical protein BH11MYX4_BH11MYX4_14990 [soil metagenome]